MTMRFTGRLACSIAISTRFDSARIPGLSGAIVHHQRINWEKGFGFAPLVGVTFGADTGYFDPEDQASRKKLVIGGSVSKTWRRISLEGELVHVPGFFTGKGDEKIITSSSVSSLTGNLIANLPGFDRLRPYSRGVGRDSRQKPRRGRCLPGVQLAARG